MKRSPLQRSPMKRRARSTGPNVPTLVAIKCRSQGACEICASARATQTHHRLPRGMGSSRDLRINLPSNLLRLCLGCHEYAETHRAEALIAGWLVSRYSDPAKVPVLIQNGSRWVNLSATESRYLDPEEVPV